MFLVTSFVASLSDHLISLGGRPESPRLAGSALGGAVPALGHRCGWLPLRADAQAAPKLRRAMTVQ